MDSGHIASLTDQNFDKELFEQKNISIVFFKAERCAVCSEMLPVVYEIAEEYKDKLKVFKVDVDDFKALAKRMRIKGIPTLILFKNGEVEQKLAGLLSKEQILNTIEKLVN
ncbi:MAG: hypothetical protein JM58_14680 [Peptococcaceae bacterium BICA1-8]|nr:MAG: hypothetical protein JM58_14680 [Peptococcaceae bacterium BICA1-8]